MGKQTSLIKVKGTLDDTTFYRKNGENFVRMKGGVDGNRIATDPKFQRTRENGAEFGAAGRAGRILRTSIKPLLHRTADGKVTSRLGREMLRVVKTDHVNPRGERNVLEGDLTQLSGFEFNIGSSLASTLFVQITRTIDRAAGNAVISVPAFVPVNLLSVPQGATHFRFLSACAAVNFETEAFEVTPHFGAFQPIDSQEAAETQIEMPVPVDSELPLFLVFGVEFAQVVNGQEYALNNGKFNCLSLLEVNVPEVA